MREELEIENKQSDNNIMINKRHSSFFIADIMNETKEEEVKDDELFLIPILWLVLNVVSKTSCIYIVI